jgi:hypothetical protein
MLHRCLSIHGFSHGECVICTYDKAHLPVWEIFRIVHNNKDHAPSFLQYLQAIIVSLTHIRHDSKLSTGYIQTLPPLGDNESFRSCCKSLRICKRISKPDCRLRQCPPPFIICSFHAHEIILQRERLLQRQ